MISVFQIYFDEKSYGFMDPDFFPYSNHVKDEYFENSVIKTVYEMDPMLKQGIKYLGVTSWKQQEKSNFTGKEILDRIQKDIDAGTEKDIYIYSPLHGVNPEYDLSVNPAILSATIEFPDIWHMDWHKYPDVAKSNKMLNDSGVLPFDLFDGKWQYCHCNYWIAKTNIYNEYCEKVLIPAIKFYEREDVKAALPKWYKHIHEGRLVTSCCFTMEGLFGAFLAHSDYSFEYLCKKKRGNKFYDIRIDGYKINNNLC